MKYESRTCLPAGRLRIMEKEIELPIVTGSFVMAQEDERVSASELLVKCLENEGVRFIFGIPGEENVAFLEALSKSSIKYIVTADERGAAFMAAAHGRLTGKPGVVATTLGPGALNIPNGLAFSHLAGIPLVALTWQRGYRTSQKDNNFQYVDVLRMLAPLTKYQRIIYSPTQISTIVKEAFRTAQTPKYGVAHIEIPEDVGEEWALPEIVSERTRIVFPSDLTGMDEMVRLLRKAKKPLLIVGMRATSLPISSLLRSIATQTGIFVITTPMAQGILPAAHPQSLYSFSHSQDRILAESILAADVILTVGYDPIEFSPRFWNSDGEKTLLHIDQFVVNHHSHFDPSIELIGDIADILFRLQKQLKDCRWELSHFRALRDTLSLPEVDTVSFPLKPQHVVSRLREVAKDAFLIHDNGMHKLWVTKFFRPDFPQQVLVDNALGCMGSGIPQGITAKLLFPDKHVIVNVGEGGFLMSMGELATAKALCLPLVILIWNNGGHGMISWHQEKRGLSQYGVSIPSLDYVKLAEGFGAVGYRIKKADELKVTLRKALRSKKLCLIDCPVDYSENMKVFSEPYYEQNAN